MFCKKYLPLHYFIYGRYKLVDRYKISISNNKGYFPFYVDFVFPLTPTNVVARFTNRSNKQKLFILRKQLGSSPVVGGVRVFTKFCFLCCVFFLFACLNPCLVYQMLPVYLDCSFLIVSLVSLDSTFLIVPLVFSRLSILDCPFGFLSIVHS